MAEMGTLECRIETRYEQGRRNVMHEDDLVDRRLKWAITVSGFLFAAYGATWIAWPKGFAEEATLLAPVLCGVGIALGVLGAACGMVAIPSIHAAHLAIRAVTRKYNTFVVANEQEIRRQKLQVWKLIGESVTHIPGFYSSLWLPYGITAVWFVLITMDLGILGFILAGALGLAEGWIPVGCTLLAVILGCALHQLVRTGLGSVRKIRKAATDSESAERLRQAGDVHNATVISMDTFEFELPPQDGPDRQQGGAAAAKGQSDV